MNGAQNSIEPGAAQAGANASLSNRRDWTYFDKCLTELRVNDVATIIERGRVLTEAKDELDHGSFEATVERHFDLSTARMCRIVAAHSVLSNRCHVNALPPSLRTLYELTKLPAALLREKLKDGSINPKTERNDVAAWRAEQHGKVEVDGRTIGRKPSLAEKLKAAETEIEKFKVKLKRAGGSLFDLHADKIEDIAAAIAANMPERRAADLAKAIPEAIKQRKRERQRPAR
jgi:hypothetical protein